MNDKVIDVLTSSCVDETVYAGSLSEYAESRNERMQKVISCVQSMEEGMTPQEIDDVINSVGLSRTTPVNLYNDTYALGDICDKTVLYLAAVDASSSEVFVQGLKGNSLSVSELADSIKAAANNSTVLSEALKIAADTNPDAASVAARFKSSIELRLGTIDGNTGAFASDVFSALMVSDGSIRDRVRAVASIAGFDSIEDDSFSADLSFPSVASEYTGASPAAAWAGDVADAIENFDASSVEAAFASAGEVLKKGVCKLWNLGKTAVSKAVTKVKQSTASAKDIEVLEGGDGSFDNVGLTFSGAYVLDGHYSNGGYAQKVPLTNLLSKLDGKQYIKYSLPGANVYLYATTEEDSSVIHGCIKWIPISKEQFNTLFTRESNIAWTLWTISPSNTGLYNNFVGKIADNVADFLSVPEFSGDTDAEFYDGIRRAQVVFCILSALCAYSYNPDFQWGSDKNVETYLKEAGLALPTAQAATPFPDDDWISNYGLALRTPIAEPTNLDFATILTNSAALASWDMTDISTIANTGPIAMFLITLESTIADQSAYVPYTHVSSVATGSYRIKSDDENAQTFSSLLKAVAVTVTAVAAVSIAAKVKTSLRKKAIVSNLQAGQAQSSLAAKLQDGTATKTDIAAAYKATKKANLMNKLSGGFGTITNGLANYAEGTFHSYGSGQKLASEFSSDDVYRRIVSA